MITTIISWFDFVLTRDFWTIESVTDQITMLLTIKQKQNNEFNITNTV